MKERIIKDMLRCYNSENFFRDLGKIHTQLDRAILYISALQQPPHSTSEEQALANEFEEEEMWLKLKTCTEDIVCALLGPDYCVEKISETEDDK